MSKSDAYEAQVLKLLLNATPISGIADNAASSPLANLYVALHTADPTDTGNQSSSEINYTGYARVAVARTTGGWTVSGSNPTVANPVSPIPFGQMTGGAGGTVTYFSVGALASGAGEIFYSGTVTPNIVVANGVTPQLTTGTQLTED